MSIRAIDYCPPTDIWFSDYLSALLTVDREVGPGPGSIQLSSGDSEELRRLYGIKQDATPTRTERGAL
jgi:hypothetical protein